MIKDYLCICNVSRASSSVVITDPITAFTTYGANTARWNNAVSTYAAAAANTLTDGIDGDGYDFNGTTPGTATYSVGTLTVGSTIVLFFQADVN